MLAGPRCLMRYLGPQKELSFLGSHKAPQSPPPLQPGGLQGPVCRVWGGVVASTPPSPPPQGAPPAFSIPTYFSFKWKAKKIAKKRSQKL